MPKKSRLGKQFHDRLITATEGLPEGPEAGGAQSVRDTSVWKYGFVLRRDQSEFLDSLVAGAFLHTRKKMERSAIIRALIDLLRVEGVDISHCTSEDEIIQAVRDHFQKGRSDGRLTG